MRGHHGSLVRVAAPSPTSNTCDHRRHPPTQAAVASVTGRAASDAGLISVQQLALCCGVPPERGCDGGWTLEDALPQLVTCGPLLKLEDCLPYQPDYRSEATADKLCSDDQLCNETSSVVSQGTFSYRSLYSVWTVQARGWGWLFFGWGWHGGWKALIGVTAREGTALCGRWAAVAASGRKRRHFLPAAFLASSPTALLLPLHPCPQAPYFAPPPYSASVITRCAPKAAVTGCWRGGALPAEHARGPPLARLACPPPAPPPALLRRLARAVRPLRAGI